MSKFWNSLPALALAACGSLSPGNSEWGSIDRADGAADEAGRVFLKADASARTNVLAHRVTLVPKARSLWISRAVGAGTFETVDGTQTELNPKIVIERVEGMRPNADGSYWLDFPPAGGVKEPLRLHLADAEGTRRILELLPGEFRPRVKEPGE